MIDINEHGIGENGNAILKKYIIGNKLKYVDEGLIFNTGYSLIMINSINGVVVYANRTLDLNTAKIIYAKNINTGASLWSWTVPNSSRVKSYTMFNDYMYIVSVDNKLYKLNMSGTLLSTTTFIIAQSTLTYSDNSHYSVNVQLSESCVLDDGITKSDESTFISTGVVYVVQPVSIKVTINATSYIEVIESTRTLNLRNIVGDAIVATAVYDSVLVKYFLFNDKFVVQLAGSLLNTFAITNLTKSTINLANLWATTITGITSNDLASLKTRTGNATIVYTSKVSNIIFHSNCVNGKVFLVLQIIYTGTATSTYRIIHYYKMEVTSTDYVNFTIAQADILNLCYTGGTVTTDTTLKVVDFCDYTVISNTGTDIKAHNLQFINKTTNDIIPYNNGEFNIAESLDTSIELINKVYKANFLIIKTSDDTYYIFNQSLNIVKQFTDAVHINIYNSGDNGDAISGLLNKLDTENICYTLLTDGSTRQRIGFYKKV